MTSSAPRPDLFRTVLSITLIGALIGLSLWVMAPFLPALIWATMIVVATWPLLLMAQRRLGGKRWAAVTVMTVALLLVFAVPLTLAIGTVIRHVDDIKGLASSFEGVQLGEPPGWVEGLPMVGPELAGTWRDAAASGHVGEKIKPYLGKLVEWFLRQIGSVGAVIAQILLSIAISAGLYMKGETAGRGIVAFARRVGEDQGEAAVRLAGQAIRGVAMGVVVTALIQSFAGGVGLAIAGVPLAALLTAIMFLLAVAQIGAVPVLACAVIWLYVRGSTGWGTALLVWTVLVGTMDNVLRPLLIKRGVDLPLVLIFTGVVGGLMALGLVGIFIGPMVLAVTWTFCVAWVRNRPMEEQVAATTGAAGGKRKSGKPA